MWRRNFVRGGSWMLAVAGLFLPGGSSRAAGFAYANFSLPSQLLFQRDATVFQNRLRLTPAERGKIGGVWFETKQNVQGGFETTFQFQFTEKSEFGADGLAFVLQNHERPVLGGGGGGIGFAGETNALAVKFDPWHRERSVFLSVPYQPYDEVAVVTGRSPNEPLTPVDAIASVTNEVMFVDQKVHTAKIVYVPGNLQVFLDDLENPLMTVYVNVAKVMNLDQGRAWVGFTAATGDEYYNQDVLSWSFAPLNSAADGFQIRATIPAAPQPETIAPLQSVNSTYTANATPSSPVPLPVDPFGYALPADVSLTHQIEASTDLVHWTTLTNTVFYFRDLESSNYNQHFYRFRLK